MQKSTIKNQDIIELFGVLAKSKEVRDNPELLKKFLSDPRGLISNYGINIPTDIAIEPHIDDDNTMYFVILQNPNFGIGDSNLTQLVAAKSKAKSLGTVGSGGTASTAFSVTGTASSISSLGTVGSAGSSKGGE